LQLHLIQLLFRNALPCRDPMHALAGRHLHFHLCLREMEPRWTEALPPGRSL
jgi:hypothetical protein